MTKKQRDQFRRRLEIQLADIGWNKRKLSVEVGAGPQWAYQICNKSKNHPKTIARILAVINAERTKQGKESISAVDLMEG